MNINYYLANIYTKNGTKYPNLDCWRLVCFWFLNEKGIKLNTYASATTEDFEKLKGEMLDNCVIKEIEEPKEGCIIAVLQGGITTHVGIYTHKKFLHANNKGTYLIPLERFTNKTKFKIKYYEVIA